MTTTQEEIKKDVIDELYWDARIDAANVQVVVEDHTVRLAGTVPSNLARQAAMEDASTIPGVQRVDNALEVQNPKSAAYPTDRVIEANVKLILDWNPEIDIQDRLVSVENGNVTLSGTVDALWKKAHADKLILDLPGVLRLQNNLAVVPAANAEDKQIAAEIIRAFDRHTLLLNNELDVRVQDGHVSLTGAVPNWSVRRAADEVVHYTPGVRGVTNDIDVIG